jgi:hypothetical protein
MALELSINVSLSSNGKTMTFTETTGAYNVNLNPRGWGSPNADLTDISEAYLVVTLPDNTNKTLFYTEVNTGLKVGDRVFILNGNYDSDSLIISDK